MFKIFKRNKVKNNSMDKFIDVEKSMDQSNSLLDEEYINVYLQTCIRPFGNYQTAWNYVMEKIVYLKKSGIERHKIDALIENVLTNLTESYVENFSEFRTIVDDISPIIFTCENLLELGDVVKAKVIADPYVSYVVSMKNDMIGKQICCQNKKEAYLLLHEFSALKDLPKTKDNYTYFIVLYCKILDSILCNIKEEMGFRNEQKKELLFIAKEISPWNAAVWEALSRTANSDEEYNEYIKKALKIGYSPLVEEMNSLDMASRKQYNTIKYRELSEFIVIGPWIKGGNEKK